ERFADPAERKARHRDAYLGRRDKRRGIGDCAPNRAREWAVLRDELLDPRPPHGDNRELGRDEKAVGKHQEKDRGQRKPEAHRRRASPPSGDPLIQVGTLLADGRVLAVSRKYPGIVRKLKQPPHALDNARKVAET